MPRVALRNLFLLAKQHSSIPCLLLPYSTFLKTLLSNRSNACKIALPRNAVSFTMRSSLVTHTNTLLTISLLCCSSEAQSKHTVSCKASSNTTCSHRTSVCCGEHAGLDCLSCFSPSEICFKIAASFDLNSYLTDMCLK